VALAS